ncbi:MAG: phosphodiesterase, partial [Solirubrobacterales bacterium]|nr:phosphodiesterase [Solirubrobacterales bacterium]
MAAGAPEKLVLAVIDGLKPSELERAVALGRAPVLAHLMQHGTYEPACCAAFPSVTPVCAASIATGVLQDEHRIPAMNWYSRAESRYVEYGSSFPAVRKFGIGQQLIDTVYNMNAQHLPADVETVFESLDDRGLRTAGTTYLMFRGRHEHKPSRQTPLTRITSQVMRRTVMGPTELFYADLYASRETGCWSRLGMPGLRDQHTGCVGVHLVEHDLFDFLLFSLPDNDTHSHEA